MRAGARKQRVVGGEAGIGDERFLALEPIAAVGKLVRRGADAGQIAARFGLGKGDGADRFAAGHRRQQRGALLLIAGQGDGVAAEPLHDEHQIVKRRLVGQGRSYKTERADRDSGAPILRRGRALGRRCSGGGHALSKKTCRRQIGKHLQRIVLVDPQPT